MASPATAAPPQPTHSFAGLLEEYAAPKKKFPPVRDLGDFEDGLEDDVATLSYEHALKSHARYRPSPLPVSAGVAPPAALQPVPHQQPQPLPHIQPDAAPRKSSSVTVRLTGEENERMRARAAEAGLTVSAYLRSCAFEVETLRAQVKEAVAGMRPPDPPPPPPQPRSWLPRLFRRRAQTA